MKYCLCLGCHERLVDRQGQFCERCQWMKALGVLVQTVTLSHDVVQCHQQSMTAPIGPAPRYLWSLDAVAFLLTARTQERKRHCAEMRAAVVHAAESYYGVITASIAAMIERWSNDLIKQGNSRV